MPRYIIGIDLGTTNCTMAYAPIPHADENHPLEIVQNAIPQITKAGYQENQYSLPSFIYFPLPEEVEGKLSAIEWDQTRPHSVGVYARDRGMELPHRLIASAKSWLCHNGVDRREKILPQKEDGEGDMSPLEACSALLQHLKESWDHQFPDDPFIEQNLLVTVPASFDPAARQLVQEAAEMAGFPETILLEEPQAAFYAWLHRHQNDWRDQLKVGEVILVVDIGGGTTDFSLIALQDNSGNLELTRLAVGSHLLLGGDNLDLALAYLAKGKLEEQGHHLDDWQMQSLVHSSRLAKEILLGEKPPQKTELTVQSRGSKLIGGTLTVTITRKEVESLILDGFLPLVKPQDRSTHENRLGMQQIGLPYAQDARISSQLAKFLSMTGESEKEGMEHFIMPTAVLFNGGTLKASALRERMVQLLNQWAKELGKPTVKVLPDPDLDYAVSIGAVYYGIARTGNAIRIKGGTSRSYYIGVEDSVPAVPGIPTPLKAVCVVPYGMEEGSEEEYQSKEFALLLGELATFRFFSHATPQLSDGTKPTIGTVVKNWKADLTELHPIETMLEKKESDGKVIRVKLTSRITELGVLELWCKAADGRKWKLEFDIRAKESAAV